MLHVWISAYVQYLHQCIYGEQNGEDHHLLFQTTSEHFLRCHFPLVYFLILNLASNSASDFSDFLILKKLRLLQTLFSLPYE